MKDKSFHDFPRNICDLSIPRITSNFRSRKFSCRGPTSSGDAPPALSSTGTLYFTFHFTLYASISFYRHFLF